MQKKLIMYLFLCIFLLNIAYGLVASISNPKVVLYRNITEGEALEIEHNVVINNPNDFDVSIRLKAAGDWVNVTRFEKEEFVVNKKNSTVAKYIVTINKDGFYNGDIIVFFSNAESPGDASAALAQIFQVGVRKAEVQNDAASTGSAENPISNQTSDPLSQPDSKQPSNFIGIAIIFAIMIIGLFFYYLIVRRVKK